MIYWLMQLLVEEEDPGLVPALSKHYFISYVR